MNSFNIINGKIICPVDSKRKIESLTIKNGKKLIISSPKNTRQGRSRLTVLSATSRNGRKKRYRGQGR